MATLGKGSSACMVLNSYHKEAVYDMKEETGPQHAKQYLFSVTVMGVEYYGRGKSKKMAKQQAAANALNAMHGIKVSLGAGAYSGGGKEYVGHVAALKPRACVRVSIVHIAVSLEGIRDLVPMGAANMYNMVILNGSCWVCV